MKYFKASVCSFASLMLYSYIHSTEELTSDIWNQLKNKYPIFEAQNVTKSKRDELLNQEFEKITHHFCGPTSESDILNPLKEFYRHTEALGMPIEIFSPLDGLDSELFQKITKGHEKGIPQKWLPFAGVSNCELFCYHYETGQVARFITVPNVDQEDTYDNFSKWIERILLRKEAI